MRVREKRNYNYYGENHQKYNFFHGLLILLTDIAVYYEIVTAIGYIFGKVS